jgi:hypothetical protein
MHLFNAIYLFHVMTSFDLYCHERVRLQLQDKSHGKPEYSGLVDCLRKMVTQEGIRAPVCTS